MKFKPRDPEAVWAQFKNSDFLTDCQIVQFRKYEEYLLEQNESFNLTAITDLIGVVRNHYQDSLMLGKYVDFAKITTFCDVGSGAGFPALPLKIKYPHLKVILIEVTRKKREFLQNVVDLLGLQDVEICADDWRTFIRTTKFPVDLFVTRAALDELELIRMFKPASPYKNTQLIYWASEQWEPHQKVAPFVKRVEPYKVGAKNRKFVFMSV